MIHELRPMNTTFYPNDSHQHTLACILVTEMVNHFPYLSARPFLGFSLLNRLILLFVRGLIPIKSDL